MPCLQVMKRQIDQLTEKVNKSVCRFIQQRLTITWLSLDSVSGHLAQEGNSGTNTMNRNGGKILRSDPIQ